MSICDAEHAETALEGAARWSHVHMVEYLLSLCTWPKDKVKKARRKAGCREVKKLLQK